MRRLILLAVALLSGCALFTGNNGPTAPANCTTLVDSTEADGGRVEAEYCEFGEGTWLPRKGN